MTKSITLLVILICPFCVWSQNTTYPRLQYLSDSVARYKVLKVQQLVSDSINERYFSPEAYDRFFDKFFTQMQYQRATFSDGNSAALTINDKTTKLNLTLSHKANNVIVSVGTSVNVSDKSGVIFSGDKPTAGTEIFGNFSYLLNSQRKLTFRGDRMETNWRKRRFLLDSQEFVHVIKRPFQANKLHADSIKHENTLRRCADSLRLFNARLTETRSDFIRQSLAQRINLYQDSVVETTDKLYKVRDEQLKLDNGVEDPEDLAGMITDSADKLSVKQQLETTGVTTFALKWVSAGVRYRRDNYSTYDNTVIFSKRISETPFDKWTINGSFNYLYQKTADWLKFKERNVISSFYVNLSGSIVRSNSFEKLKETDLSLIRSTTQNDSVYEFSKPYKVRDIANKTFTKQWIYNPSITLTPMFGKQQFVGLNLIGSGEFQESFKPVFNMRSGLLFSFKDSEKEKSVVNFELFLSFADLTDTQHSGKSVWQNKQIGVSANVPFEKVFFR